jgi:phospholipid transport system substrate-binding protein
MQTTTRALLRAFVAMAAFLATGLVQAQTPVQEGPAPDVLVKNVTLEVVDLITKDKEIQAGSRAKLIELIEAKVLPNFNFSAMTALALGQSWNKATAEQKKRLVEEFRTLLVRTYASALAAFAGQKFDFRPLRAKPTDTSG